MSTSRIAAPDRFRQPKERGPNGRPLCRRCKSEVPKGRQAWCSQACYHEYGLVSSPSYARHHVGQRDKGVCAECARDCAALHKRFNDLRDGSCGYKWRRTDPPAKPELDALIDDLNAQGFALTRYTYWDGAFWQADHIRPVVEGGGECGLDNYRTLCTPCHKKQTAALRKRLAETNKVQRALADLPLFGGSK